MTDNRTFATLIEGVSIHHTTKMKKKKKFCRGLGWETSLLTSGDHLDPVHVRKLDFIQSPRLPKYAIISALICTRSPSNSFHTIEVVSNVDGRFLVCQPKRGPLPVEAAVLQIDMSQITRLRIV